jgi:hypothetical protein
MHRCLFICLAILAIPSAAPEVEIIAEPHHHLVLENQSVRVFKVDVPPHSDTLMHWHRHDYIYVTLGDTEVVNAVKDKPPVTLKLRDGETRFSPATFAHIARNLSDQPFRNITIEILEDESLRHSTAHWEQDRGLEPSTVARRKFSSSKMEFASRNSKSSPVGLSPCTTTTGRISWSL